MTSIENLRLFATDKSNFTTAGDYLDFARRYSDFLASDQLQAVIVARNETNYRFFQYREDAGYQVTRPINANLYYAREDLEAAVEQFVSILLRIKDGETIPYEERETLPRVIYTAQQSIGAALDALPAKLTNQARKVNGDLFERFIGLLVKMMGVDCKSGVLAVPVKDDHGTELFKMNYQHDMMLEVDGELRAIGSVKTSSKDRIDKVFMDKFLFGRLTETDLPHIAIFLNDVQRKGVLPNYGVNSTFLPGHFKAYTVKLNALDGVYYCDIRPNMRVDPLLKEHISTIDRFFCDDLPRLMVTPGLPSSEVVVKPDENIP